MTDPATAHSADSALSGSSPFPSGTWQLGVWVVMAEKWSIMAFL